MRETIAYTDVIDAADGNDRFDLSAHIEFSLASEQGTVRRQQVGGGSVRIADSTARRSQLLFGLDIGLFKDLMASVKMPLILAESNSLRAVSGRSPADVQADLDDPVGDGGRTEPLFVLASANGGRQNFNSPTRAGLDYIGMGLSWGVINQMRRPNLPTLVLSIEGQLAVGPLMRPCQRLERKTVCGNPGLGDFGSNAGSSRGLNGFRFETRTSHRYRYAEPYAGIGVLVQWPSKKGEQAFWPVGDTDGYIHRLPGQRVNTEIGAVFLPWENRARFQRVGLDVQAHGMYVTEGHDYSVLFDALGTSKHPQVATPLPEGNIDPDTGGDPALRTGGYTGLADVQAHFRYGFKLGLEVQAARYVRFQLGSSLNWITSHTITAADPCNPRVDVGAMDPRRGTCGKGVINPHHRGAIDLPGRRFLMTQQFVYDLYFGAVASF